MTRKETILEFFDKSITESKSNDEMDVIVITVCLRGSAAGGQGLAIETLVIDQFNFKRKKDYFSKCLDDDGSYMNSNKEVLVGNVAYCNVSKIEEAILQQHKNFYSAIIGEI